MTIQFRKHIVLLIAALFVGLAVVPALAEKGGKGGGGGGEPFPVFQWTPLGTLGGRIAYAYDINNYSDVVGSSWVVIETSAGPQTYEHAFLNVVDENGDRGMIDLHELFKSEGLLNPPLDYETRIGWQVTYAWEINDHGQIVGSIADFGGPGSSTTTFGFRYTPASIDELGDPLPSRLDTLPGSATCINNAGVVAGLGVKDGVYGWPYIWDEVNGTQFFETFRAGFVLGINSSNQVVGSFRYSPWIYTPGVGYRNIFNQDVYDCSVGSINDLGDVAGWERSNIFNLETAFRTDGTSVQYLGPRGKYSTASHINNRGDVVGRAEFREGVRPFLYIDTHGTKDLIKQSVNAPVGVSPSSRSFPRSINESREIVADFLDYQPDQTYEPYLLTPVE